MSRMKEALYILLLGICLAVSGWSMMRQSELEARLLQMEAQAAARDGRFEEMRDTQLALLELYEAVFVRD